MHITKSSYLKIAPLILLIGFVGLSPFGNAFIGSFFHDVYGDRSFAGLDNYKLLFSDSGFNYSLNITVLWAVLNAFLSITIGFLFAVRLVKRSRFGKFFYITLLIPWGIPVYIAVPLWRALIHGNGGQSLLTILFGIKINLLTQGFMSFIATLAVSLWMTVPLTAFVFLGALRTIPRSVIESATMDGAGEGELAFHIFLPQIRGSLLVMGVLNFIKALKEFTVVLLMTAGGPPLVSGITERHIIGSTTTLGIFLYDIFSSTDDFGVSSAYSIVMALVVVLIMGLWFIVRSKDAGHIKIKLFTALTQPLFAGPIGFLWAAGYLVSLKKPRVFLITAVLQLGFSIVQILRLGFLHAFHPGIVFVIFGLIMIYWRSIKFTRLRYGVIKPVWFFSSYGGAVCMIFGTFTVLYLLVWMSFSEVSAAYIDSVIPRFFSASSYRDVVVEENIFRFFINTLIVSGLTAVCIPLITFPAATFLAWKGQKFSRGFLTFIQVIGIAGGMHTLIPLYSLFNHLGLTNSYTPLVMIYLYHAVPFSMFTMKAYLDDLPVTLEDAARLEGMRPFSYMVRILFPLCRPVITTSVMVAFLAAWNGFMAPLLFLNDDTKYTISLKLYSFVGSIASGSPKWNLFAAASIINSVIIMALFLRFRRPVQTTELEEVEE